MISEHVERRLLADAVPLHQDPLRPLRDGPPPERAFQIVVLGEAPQDDIDGALHLLGIMPLGDVGEDAALSGLLDGIPGPARQ